jgi:TolB protein
MTRTARRLGAMLGLLGASALMAPAPAAATFPGQVGRLAFVQGLTGGGNPAGINLIDLTGTGPARPIGPSCSEDVAGSLSLCADHPAWRADGTRLAFTLGAQIATMDADGGIPRAVPTPGLTALRPGWAPDGRTLVFEGRGAGRANLYLVRPDGSGLRRLTGAGGGQPSWAADGLIAFRRKRNLFVIDARGRRLRRLTRRGASQPDFAPGARAIAFERRGELHVLDLRTGTARRVVAARRLRATRLVVREPAFTPDGRQIVFDLGSSDGSSHVLVRIRPSGRGRATITRGQEGRITSVSAPAVQPLPARL